MSRLNVAICLSGLIGSNSKFGKGETINFKLAKQYFDRNLINKNVDVRFFLHCWENLYQNEIIKLYKPEKYSFEKPLERNAEVNPKEYGLISSNYSKFKVNELKKKYENEKGIIFDFVILTRFDILILERLDYGKLNKHNFYVVGPKIHHHNTCKCTFCNEEDPNHSLNDLFFLSSSAGIDKFSEAYHHLKEYGIKSSHHVITKKHLLKTGLYNSIDFIFKFKANKYASIWIHLEKIGIFPKGLVAVRIYDTNVPLIRWVDKPYYLKFLDFFIFKTRIDIMYEYLIKIFKLRSYKLLLQRCHDIFS